MKEMRQALVKLSDIRKEVDARLKAIGTAGGHRGLPAYPRDTRVGYVRSFALPPSLHSSLTLCKPSRYPHRRRPVPDRRLAQLTQGERGHL